MMKVAVPVFDESLRIFGNTGHTPFFAVFEQKGSGMFKQFNLLELRENPRGNVEASEGCSHKDSDMTQEEQIAHKLEHNVLGEIIKDCQAVLVKKALQKFFWNAVLRFIKSTKIVKMQRILLNTSLRSN